MQPIDELINTVGSLQQVISLLKENTERNMIGIQEVITSTIKTLTDKNHSLMLEIESLKLNYASIYALHMGLLASIAFTEPDLFQTIRETAESELLQLSAENMAETEHAQRLRDIAGIKPQSKPQLRIVKPRVVPDSETE